MDIKPIYKSVIPDNFRWMKKGMLIESDPKNDCIFVHGRNYIKLSQFEKEYGELTSGEKLGEDFFWHVKALFAWHDFIKPKILKAKNTGAISIALSELLEDHDIPKEYVVHIIQWFMFKINNEIVDIDPKLSVLLDPIPPRKPDLKIIK